MLHFTPPPSRDPCASAFGGGPGTAPGAGRNRALASLPPPLLAARLPQRGPVPEEGEAGRGLHVRDGKHRDEARRQPPDPADPSLSVCLSVSLSLSLSLSVFVCLSLSLSLSPSLSLSLSPPLLSLSRPLSALSLSLSLSLFLLSLSAPLPPSQSLSLCPPPRPHAGPAHAPPFAKAPSRRGRTPAHGPVRPNGARPSGVDRRRVHAGAPACAEAASRRLRPRPSSH